MATSPFERFVQQLEPAFREGDPEAYRKGPEAENVRLLRETYEALLRGDHGAALDRFDDAIRLEITGPPAIPFLGRWRGRAEVGQAVVWRGRAEVGQAVARNFGMVENQEPEVRSVAAQRDTVVVAHGRGRVRTTGSAYALHWVQIFQLSGGRIARVLEVVDGYALEVGPSGRRAGD